jgi:hypothetical protein
MKDFTNFHACLFQQVPVTVGHYVRFSVWVRVSTGLSLEDSQTRIGIDPSGGTDPRAIQYEMHPELWDPYTNWDQWQQLSIVTLATSPKATVYACAHPRWPQAFAAYWDDAAVSVVPEQLTYMPAVEREHCTFAPGALRNPDLERDACTIHGYQPISGYTNIFIAPYGSAFWNNDYIPETNENKQPECNYTDRSYRVHAGAVAQQCGLSGGGTFEGGIYQVVTGTVPGDTLRFTIWGMGWNQHWGANDPDGENEFVSDYQEEDGLRFRVGIDPTGGEAYTSTAIVWSELANPYDAWQQFEITATAAATRVSVWAYAHPGNPGLRWNQSFWDDAALEVVTQH